MSMSWYAVSKQQRPWLATQLPILNHLNQQQQL
jgi:hypothetical protein